MSTRSEREKNLRGLRQTLDDVGGSLAHKEVGTRAHELYSQLHHHLGRVIEISEEIIELEHAPPTGRGGD